MEESYYGMFLGTIVISIFCVFDDIVTIKPLVKLAGQVIAAIIVVTFGVRINEMTPVFLATSELKEAFSIVLTIGWIVVVTNAINLIDGLDRIISRNFSNISCFFNDYFCAKWFTINFYFIDNRTSRSISGIFTI